MTDDQFFASRRKGFGYVKASRPDQCDGTGQSYADAAKSLQRLNGARNGYWMAHHCAACNQWHTVQKEIGE